MAIESPSDEYLLLQILEGNSVAFATLVRRHSMRYYHLACRYMEYREEAEDIVQAAFLKLWERPDMWDERKGVKFTTWFYRLVVNLCLDFKKKPLMVAMEDSMEIRDERYAQEEKIESQEICLLLTQEIGLLPEKQKKALILCVYEEMSHKKAAEVMKISVKALQSLLMRAKTTLKNNMKCYI